MTTKDSPFGVLRSQARKIAQAIKNAESGRGAKPNIIAKIEVARMVGVMTVGVAMDDRIITIKIPFATITSTTEAALTEYVLKLMLETRNAS